MKKNKSIEDRSEHIYSDKPTKKSKRKYAPTDIYRFIESLKYRPETYKTILLDQFNNKHTETSKLRKKLSRFVRQGFIASGTLAGQSGSRIFYSLEKKYYIFIALHKGKYHCYYCSDVDDSGSEIVLFNTFILRANDWEYLGNVALIKNEINRWF
jgi:hypothetical protein